MSNTGNRNSGDWNSGYCNSGDCNSGNRNSGNCNSGDCNSGYCNSGDCNSGYRNSGNCNSGDRNSGNRNSGNRNSGDHNSGDHNSGDHNSGNCNSGDWNSGMFNIITPKPLMFNKQSDIALSDMDLPSFDGFNVSYWIPEENMTEQEKKENPTYKTTGGFTKKVEYKEAWAIFWRQTTEGNKQKFLNLPNFDAAIFKEITGIDVEENDDVTITVEGKEKVISRKSAISLGLLDGK